MTSAISTRGTRQNDSEICTIDELIKRRAFELKDSPLLAYPSTGFTDYEKHSAAAIDRYVDAAVAVLQRQGLHAVVSIRRPDLISTVLT